MIDQYVKSAYFQHKIKEISVRKPYPSETQDRFMVRLPEGMRDQIAEAAKKSNRTMNGEIVARLEASFDPLNLIKEPWEHSQAPLGKEDILASSREQLEFTVSSLAKRLASVEKRLSSIEIDR